LVFTTQNWATAQTVTATGVADSAADGDDTYTAVPGDATGGDYDGNNPDDAAASNTDDDTAGVTVTPTSTRLVTTEAGGMATFTVVLDSQPSADVTIGVSSNDTTVGTASTSSLVVTTQNWATAQTVTVTGVDDSVEDGDVTYTVVLGVATGGDYDRDQPGRRGSVQHRRRHGRGDSDSDGYSVVDHRSRRHGHVQGGARFSALR
jgi:hypothetical protein